MLWSFVCFPVLCHAVVRVLCVVARMFAYWSKSKESTHKYIIIINILVSWYILAPFGFFILSLEDF